MERKKRRILCCQGRLAPASSPEGQGGAYVYRSGMLVKHLMHGSTSTSEVCGLHARKRPPGRPAGATSGPEGKGRMRRPMGGSAELRP
jgi:hypothetical protein